MPPPWEVKVLQVPPLWEVKVQQVPPLWEVKMLVLQDACLTRPCVRVEGEANHVAPPPHQLQTELGVYRLGQEDNGEVTPTALLALAADRAYVTARVPRWACGMA